MGSARRTGISSRAQRSSCSLASHATSGEEPSVSAAQRGQLLAASTWEGPARGLRDSLPGTPAINRNSLFGDRGRRCVAPKRGTDLVHSLRAGSRWSSATVRYLSSTASRYAELAILTALDERRQLDEMPRVETYAR